MCRSAVMDNPQRGKQDRIRQQIFNHLETLRQAVPVLPNHRLAVLGLGILNAILLLAAIVTGINCAKAKQGSLQVSHATVEELISGLDDLRSNHSNVIEAKEEAKREFEAALQNHAQMKKKIAELKAINDNCQNQTEAMEKERASLKANYTALMESCGCPSKWIHFNSSCYLFSFAENSALKKNWDDSRADCIRRGADLVVINRPDEQTFVSHTIETMKTGRHFWDNSFWLGLRDTEVEGEWVWINNVTEVDQRYWMEGEPNDSGHHGEDCGATFYSDQNPWKTRNDAHCRINKIHWICEKALK